MDNSNIEDALDHVKQLFEQQPSNVETGLEVDEPALLQLRKSCRLLEASQHLEQENGYYTVVIEACFAVIERTLQFYLLENRFLEPDEYIDHREVYERSHEAGLYNEQFKEKLVGLWRDNRSRTYYREGVGSMERSQKMLELAEQIHNHVLQLSGESHKCICNTASP